MIQIQLQSSPTLLKIKVKHHLYILYLFAIKHLHFPRVKSTGFFFNFIYITRRDPKALAIPDHLHSSTKASSILAKLYTESLAVRWKEWWFRRKCWVGRHSVWKNWRRRNTSFADRQDHWSCPDEFTIDAAILSLLLTVPWSAVHDLNDLAFRLDSRQSCFCRHSLSW